jgi:hypothetical protein
MTLVDLIFIALVYGAPVFMVARILQVILLRNYSFTWRKILIILLLVQCVSVFLMLMMVRYWPFNFGAILGIIAWPALFGEVLLTALGYLYLIKFTKK